jgi:outer membrane protein assembly factor BamD (BamD/ComL family)
MFPMQCVLRPLVCLLWCWLYLFAGGCSFFGDRSDLLYGADEESGSSIFSMDYLKRQYNEMTGNGPDPVKARQHFQEAESFYAAATRQQDMRSDAAQEQLLAAAEKYELAAQRWPKSTVEEQSWYRLGECYFFTDQYPKADDAYAKLVKHHPHTKYLDLAQARRFSIAQYWLAQHDHDPLPIYAVNLTDDSQPLRDGYGRAIKIFDNIRLDDPTGRLADDATLALGNAHFAARNFLRADEYYSDLRKTFPNSEHQFRAHFLGLKSKLESYMGVDYSAKPLDEAEKLLKQINRQFPVEAEQERSFLSRAAGEIRFRKAERCWHRAQRHYRRAEFGAAKMYYQSLFQDYGDTEFAQRARAQLNEIRGRPDTPPQRLQWLADWFPEETTVKPLVATGNTPQRR